MLPVNKNDLLLLALCLLLERNKWTPVSVPTRNIPTRIVVKKKELCVCEFLINGILKYLFFLYIHSIL